MREGRHTGFHKGRQSIGDGEEAAPGFMSGGRGAQHGLPILPQVICLKRLGVGLIHLAVTKSWFIIAFQKFDLKSECL